MLQFLKYTVGLTKKKFSVKSDASTMVLHMQVLALHSRSHNPLGTVCHVVLRI